MAFPFNRSIALTTGNLQCSKRQKLVKHAKFEICIYVFWCKEKKNRAHAKWTDSLPFWVSLWMLRTACVLHKPLKMKINSVKLEIVRRMFGMRFQMFVKWINIRSMPTSRIRSRCASGNNIVSASFRNECGLRERYVDCLKIYKHINIMYTIDNSGQWPNGKLHLFFVFLLVFIIRNRNTNTNTRAHTHNAECVEII